MIDYLKIISKYINPQTTTYHKYIIHSVLVTTDALQIAKNLNLDKESLDFIEEASMLHDIGICKVQEYRKDCGGNLPYICHGVEGAKILRSEGLEKHALVAERHNGVGIFKDEIISKNLPLPPKDYLPISIEEEIIGFADIFYSKSLAKLWDKKSIEEAREEISVFSDQHEKLFDEKVRKFLG